MNMILEFMDDQCASLILEEFRSVRVSMIRKPSRARCEPVRPRGAEHYADRPLILIAESRVRFSAVAAPVHVLPMAVDAGIRSLI
jgi:hypothetical protein